MKTRYITVILITLLFENCMEKRQPYTPPPFKPALEQVIIELINSLKDEIKGQELLSIEFCNPKHSRRGCMIQFFISEWYASSTIDGFTKIDKTTIAIYNLKNDVFEMVNKNNITFFTDAVVGFRDTCLMRNPEKPFFYSIYGEDSIRRVPYEGYFPKTEIIRLPKCKDIITFTPPEEFRFHDDSLQAEENLRYYQKEVEYYRNMRNMNRLSSNANSVEKSK